jgi:hypothetical protein
MSKKDVVILLIILGVGGYSFYGSMTGTGPVGWLNYAQQAISGEYSVKLSFVLAVGLLVVLFAIAEFVWNMLSGSQDGFKQSIAYRLLFGARATPATPPASQGPATTPASQGRVLLQTAIIFVVATWTIGFAIYWWYAAEQREDASAQYKPVDLSDGAPMHRPQGSHITLRGGVPLNAALVHETGSGGSTRKDYQLVPIASRDWVKGQAVTFVVKIKNRSELQYPIPTRPSAQGNQATTGVLMARIDGPVPGPVALEFKKIGVPLGEPNYLLRPVKTRDGKVITESIDDAFMFFLAFCGLVSAVVCAIMGGAWIIRAKAGRKGSS